MFDTWPRVFADHQSGASLVAATIGQQMRDPRSVLSAAPGLSLRGAVPAASAARDGWVRPAARAPRSRELVRGGDVLQQIAVARALIAGTTLVVQKRRQDDHVRIRPLLLDARAASTPSMFGITRSISTTSG
jgi:hypothetical protein